MKLVLPLLAIIVVFFGILMADNSIHGAGTWWSYVAFGIVFLFVMAVVVRAVYNGLAKKKTLNDKARMLLLLVVAGSLLSSCVPHLASTKPKPEPTEEQLFPKPLFATDKAGWTVVVVADTLRR